MVLYLDPLKRYGTLREQLHVTGTLSVLRARVLPSPNPTTICYGLPRRYKCCIFSLFLRSVFDEMLVCQSLLTAALDRLRSVNVFFFF